MDVSIIIPVYNAEKYIEKCLDSLLWQTFTDWEALLLDDGSRDQSAKICSAYCKKDARFRYLRLTHEGPSAVRNRGLKEAKGSYVFFLDSDDAIHPSLLEKELSLFEDEDTVMVSCDYLEIPEDRWEQFENQELCGIRDVKLTGPLKAGTDGTYLGRMNFVLAVIGGKMIRRDKCRELCFDTEISVSEDSQFIYQVLKCGSFRHIEEKWYYYQQRNDSLSRAASMKNVIDTHNTWRKIALEELQCGRILNARECRMQEVMRLILFKAQYGNRLSPEEKRSLEELFREVYQSEKTGGISWFRKADYFLGWRFYPMYITVHGIWHRMKQFY